MNDDEPKYTLSEALAEERRRQCEFGGHGPYTVIREAVGRAVSAYCECGSVRWAPVSPE